MSVGTIVPFSSFNTTVQLVDGSLVDLPVSLNTPLFVVGPNGAGKSGLMLALYRENFQFALRVAAHRQNGMESNSVPFSPQDKVTTAENAIQQDIRPSARWTEWHPTRRTGLVLADIIDTNNALARKVRAALAEGNDLEVAKLLIRQTPIEVVNELFVNSGIPIVLSLTETSAIVASKNGGLPYSAASLYDGERAALLVSGAVLTAKAGSLILIDEPERHLHSSISVPLLSQLIAKRPDCAFVISTHELSLPVSFPDSRTVLIRDSVASGDDIQAWDIDVLDPGVEINDDTKEAILGAKRKMLFIEGTQDSLDKPLYEILFPGVSIYPRASCTDVEHAVESLRDTGSVAWVQAFGIVDQDQISPDRKAVLETKGVFPLTVYSVESLYYGSLLVEAVARRQALVVDTDANQMIATARAGLITAIAAHVDRLAARMTEQAVKDQVSVGMLDWRKIQMGQNVTINVDAQAIYQSEKSQLSTWLAGSDVEKIVMRYPIRETGALAAIVNALQFKSRQQYEAAARKAVREEGSLRTALMSYFGNLPATIG